MSTDSTETGDEMEICCRELTTEWGSVDHNAQTKRVPKKLKPCSHEVLPWR